MVSFWILIFVVLHQGMIWTQVACLVSLFCAFLFWQTLMGIHILGFLNLFQALIIKLSLSFSLFLWFQALMIIHGWESPFWVFVVNSFAGNMIHIFFWQSLEDMIDFWMWGKRRGFKDAHLSELFIDFISCKWQSKEGRDAVIIKGDTWRLIRGLGFYHGGFLSWRWK